MILDARAIPPDTIVDTDICIVGAGAAGISMARALSDSRFRVTLLESGGMQFEAETQKLYEGQNIGLPYPDVTTDRLRFFGGTTNHRGRWCLPLDPIDFLPREDFPYHGWPFDRSALDPWYARAQQVCQLGPYDYRPASWGIPASRIPQPFAGPDFTTKILQPSGVFFGPAYAQELRTAPRVTVYLHANAFHFDAGDNDAEIKQLLVKTLSGNRFTIKSRCYVLAAGGIENARLLLASGTEAGPGLGNAHDLVGRFFMVHLAYEGGTIVPADPRQDLDFRSKGQREIDGGRHSYFSYIGLSEAGMRTHHLQNIFLYWGYKFSPVVDGVKALERLMDGEGPGGSRLHDLGEVISHLEGVAEFAARKALFKQGIPIESMLVECASEQQPNPQSRITLGSRRDQLGMRESVVDWQLLPEDKASAVATLRLLGTEIGRAGFGRFRSPLAEDGAWPANFVGNDHHMGTTRMHVDPAQGVVDPNCRVHSVSNLYVASSSVFPTGGANNPTLTIVALALRLADHLRTLLS